MVVDAIRTAVPELFTIAGSINYELFDIIRRRLQWHSRYRDYTVGAREMARLRAEYDRFRAETPAQRMWGAASEAYAGSPIMAEPPDAANSQRLTEDTRAQMDAMLRQSATYGQVHAPYFREPVPVEAAWVPTTAPSATSVTTPPSLAGEYTFSYSAPDVRWAVTQSGVASGQETQAQQAQEGEASEPSEVE